MFGVLCAGAGRVPAVVQGVVLFLAFGLLGWGQQFERVIPYLGLTEAQLDQILQRGDVF